MTAYDSMRLEDLLQRQDALTTKERALFARLYAQGEAEHEAEATRLPRPFMYGGDYPNL